jgi:tetratricopeptide (TPR) repeat protein
LNTGWYIKQLQQRDPKVPISYNDAYIDRYLDGHDAQAILSRYWPPEKQHVELNTPDGKMEWTVPAAMYVPYKEKESRQPNFLRVQDWMILDILRTNYDPSKTPVPRPIYFAVTVANSNMIGLRDNLTMEGLVFRVNPKSREQLDPDLIQHHLFETFQGHFRGIDDPAVHFDDNIQKLLQNYRSAFLQLAYYYSSQPESPEAAPAAYESLDDRKANFDKLSNRQKALTLLEMMDEVIPESVRPISNPELSVQLGRMYADLGKPDELRRRLEMASQRRDLRLETRARLASFWITSFGDTQKARRLIDAGLEGDGTQEDYYTIGSQLYSGGASALAADYFERIYRQDPSDGQIIGALLQSYENSGQRDKAAQLLEEWVQRHPQDRGAQQRLDQLRQRTLADTISPTKVN